MSETKKSDGELPKDGDNVVLDGDKEFRNSRLSLAKEKTSPDGAHEKLLQKEDEAKIVRVDMVDAKFVSGDHRNGDPKIELDANKKQFSGLTKEELMKYADDPFWVKLRWFMFVLFWALWLGMLAGAITIIVRAPKCAAPTPRSWYEKGPLAEIDLEDFSAVEGKLLQLRSSNIEGIFIKAEAYDVLDKSDVLDRFKKLVEKAKEYSIKVILDLTPNYVSITHPWFLESVNKTAPYADYFTWANGSGFDADNDPKPPNSWVSTLNESAWSYSPTRDAFYLHQFAANQADLNFNLPAVRSLFSAALKKWMGAGAAGVRLNKARLMLVNPKLKDETMDSGRGSVPGSGHDHYVYYRHTETADQPGLDLMLTGFAADAAAATSLEPKDTVFTLKEDGGFLELYLLERVNATKQRPPSAAPVFVTDAAAVASQIIKRINDTAPQPDDKVRSRWPLLQLKADSEKAEQELAYFAFLLPAAPVLNSELIDNHTKSELSHLSALRSDASVEHGEYYLSAVVGRQLDSNSTQLLLACSRWKAGHTGYVAVYNPTPDTLRANLTAVGNVPASLSVHHVSPAVKTATNYTNNYSEQANNVLVPGKSTVILSYVPDSAAKDDSLDSC